MQDFGWQPLASREQLAVHRNRQRLKPRLPSSMKIDVVQAQKML
jgi:hypothetical protein